MLDEYINQNIKHYKVYFIALMLFLSSLFFLFLVVFQKTFSTFVANNELALNVTTAMYIFEEGLFDFNIDVDKIIPSATPYVYPFTIANYNEEKRSDVDIDYEIEIITTTNLPLRYELYKNEEYNAAGAANIISATNVINDNDGAWYYDLQIDQVHHFYYNTSSIDTYYLVIYFPEIYSEQLNYQGLTENIEVNIFSKQVIDEN